MFKTGDIIRLRTDYQHNQDSIGLSKHNKYIVENVDKAPDSTGGI